MPGSSRSRSTSRSGSPPRASSGASVDPVLRQRLDRAGAAADDAELGDPLDRRGGESAGRGEGAIARRARASRCRCRSARPGGGRAFAQPATVTCWPSTARTASSKRVDAARQAQPRCAGQARRAARRSSPGAASRSSQRRTAAITAPLAGPSAGANESRTRAASPAKRASEPARRSPAVPIAPARSCAGSTAPSTTSMPGIARCARKASSDVDVVRRAVAERDRDRRLARSPARASRGAERPIGASPSRAQPRRIHPVAAGERGVEAAQALESRSSRDLRDRHLRVGAGAAWRAAGGASAGTAAASRRARRRRSGAVPSLTPSCAATRRRSASRRSPRCASSAPPPGGERARCVHHRPRQAGAGRDLRAGT